MRFYYDHNDYGELFIRIDDKVYCFDLIELTEKIIDNGEDIEAYCNLALWNSSDAAFNLNDDEHLKEFMGITQSDNVYEITHYQMVDIIKNCVATHILETRTDCTIKEVSKMLGQGVIDHLTDILWDNLKEFTFIK